jgi:hypothetical protein
LDICHKIQEILVIFANMILQVIQQSYLWKSNLRKRLQKLPEFPEFYDKYPKCFEFFQDIANDERNCRNYKNHQKLYLQCFQCGNFDGFKKLLQCANCKLAYYCGPKCQRKHWKLKHKFECNKSH